MISTWMISVLMLVAVQDGPTTPSASPRDPFPHFDFHFGTGSSIGYATGRGQKGESRDRGAALGLSAEARIVNPSHGAMHAIAEIPVRAGAPAKTREPDGPRTRSSRAQKRGEEKRTRAKEATPPGGEAPTELVYGFAAVARHALLDDGDRARPADRSELYLLDRAMDRHYHAVLERGLLIEESGDRALYDHFAAAGRDAWMQPFDRDRFGRDLALRGRFARLARPGELVGDHLERTVQDLKRPRRGRAHPRLADATTIEPGGSGTGAWAHGTGRSTDRGR
ncbi:MAG: hypothetical protein RL885_00585 [Planctomycetota bacterium]